MKTGGVNTWSAAAPRSPAARALAAAAAVCAATRPAATGTRSPICRTANRSTASRSSGVSSAPSPVSAFTTTPASPHPANDSRCASSDAQSIDSSSRIGVATPAITPAQSNLPLTDERGERCGLHPFPVDDDAQARGGRRLHVAVRGDPVRVLRRANSCGSDGTGSSNMPVPATPRPRWRLAAWMSVYPQL